MKPEIEAKFLDVDHDALRARLKELGAECIHPMCVTKRKNYDFPDGRLEKIRGWVRLRDSGNKIELSYKQLHDRGLDGTHEVDFTLDNMDAADAFLRAIGLVQVNYQETKRESWVLDGCEIELDEWPWIRPFLEIEGPDEQALQSCARRLGLEWSEALHGSVEIAYQAEYNVSEQDVYGLSLVAFGAPVPDLFQTRRRK